jgi:hypothetical protein
LSAEKCSYIVFSKSNRKTRINIKLFERDIPYDEASRFLGVYFDEKLTFRKQVQQISDKCVQRLNVIKIVSHRSWMLSEQALLNTYFCLIRSILDYSFIINQMISTSNLLILQRIQNRAVKYIFRPQLGTNLVDFASSKKILKIEARLENLFLSFIMKGLINNNPLLNTLVSEYRDGFEARPSDSKTCLFAIRAMLL